jgi:type I restriction enzyme, S subunit
MWTQACIGDVLTLIQNGVNCKQDKGGVGHKITRIETIAGSNINYEKTGFAELDEKQKSKARLETGDILFSHINSPAHVGKTAIYDGEEPLFHGINLLRLRTIGEVDSSYFNMFLISLFQSGYWRRTAKQSVNQASVNQRDIKAVQFSYPSLAEQQRIVEKLDAAFAEIDRGIEVTLQQLTEADALYKTSLQSCFDDEGVRRKPLSEICKITSTKRVMKKDYVSEGVPFYRTKEVKQLANNQPVTTELFIAKQHFDSLRNNFGAPEKGDILITAIGTIGEVYVVKDGDEFYFKDGNVLWLKDIIDVNQEYLRYGLMSFVRKINTMAHGAAYSALPIQRLKAFELPMPSLEEQIVVVNHLTNVSEEVSSLTKVLESKLEVISSLKSAILTQKLQPPQSKAA